MPANIDDLVRYLDASPSPFHAVRTSVEILDAAGFEVVADRAIWAEVPTNGYVVRDGGIIAWRQPDNPAAATPFRMVGAHTDSPNLRIKPNPNHTGFGWEQLNVEVYGGILNNTWLDRDLAAAGRVVMPDGAHILIDTERPIARVPQLAVHLDRGVNDNGLKLDRQQHLRPVWATEGSGSSFTDFLVETAGLDDDPMFWEIGLYDVQPAAVIGADRSFLVSGRIDNLASCWAALAALLDATAAEHTAMIVLNDHEEVGSSSATGAGGPFLERTIERIVEANGGERRDMLVSLSNSILVSADNAHAIHPNYPEVHDEEHAPMVNQGPAIKFNANQRYATSSRSAAMFAAACDTAGAKYQSFVCRNNLPCGSTIGPITAARLGVDIVDVGIPQLSMHSAREMCGTYDPVALTDALTVMLSG